MPTFHTTVIETDSGTQRPTPSHNHLVQLIIAWTATNFHLSIHFHLSGPQNHSETFLGARRVPNPELLRDSPCSYQLHQASLAKGWVVYPPQIYKDAEATR